MNTCALFFRILSSAFAVFASTLVLHSSWLSAQGDLTPPGAPAPTMKALDQIEPRIIVNAANTPGDTNSLFKIVSSGSYYLTGNITGVSGKHGIIIAAPNVTLDLNGFSLIGVPGSLDGINATNSPALAAGLTIRKGVVGGWGGNGINALPGAPGACFSDLRLLTNTASGLQAVGAVVKDCVAQGNTAGNNNFNGIYAQASRVVNCVARAGSNGIRVGAGSLVEGCVTTDSGTGFLADNSSVLHCTALNSTFQGMYLFGNNRIAGNLVDGNGHGSGIVVAAGNVGNTIDENMLIANPTAGILLTNSGVANNFVIRNNVRGAGANNYLTGTNSNAFGPIVNVSGTNDISSVPNANHPWANFSY